MNKNKHLLLWSSLGALALLIFAAVEENVLKRWRRIQSAAAEQAAAAAVDVRLRQIVVPGLKATDRCVTCHVGMAPGEEPQDGHPMLAAHPPLPHDPHDFGCTVCHGGQGRATEMADAHGEVLHWPEPMIPAPHAYAGCGSCHTQAGAPTLAGMYRGRDLMERHDCLACHRVDGRGGTVRPGAAGGMEGPDLSQVGLAGYDPQWYEKHLAQSRTAAEGPWAVSFGPLEDKERRAIGDYLASRIGAPRLAEAKALFHTLGCQGCHRVFGVGGDDGPDLTRVGLRDPGQVDFSHVEGPRTLSNWHEQHLRNPAQVVPGSAMPAMGLSDEQIELLTLYLLSLRRGDLPGAYWPKDRVRTERLGEREFARDGATLYGTFCSACHGAEGEGRRYPDMPRGPAIANPDFLRAASDEFLAASIREGRSGRRMPAWGDPASGLSSEDVEAVIGHLRRVGGVPEGPPPAPARVTGNANLGRSLYAVHCAGCHGARGEGDDGPALRHPALLAAADDHYLVETIGEGRRGTPMPGFRRPQPTHPVLSDEQIRSIVAFLRTWEILQP